MGDAVNVRIDYDRLELLAQRLDSGREQLDGTESFTDEVAEATGHDGLAGTVRDFSSSWDAARADLIDQLALVRDYIRAVHDTFRELDRRLGEGVETDLDAAVDALESRYADLADDPR